MPQAANGQTQRCRMIYLGKQGELKLPLAPSPSLSVQEQSICETNPQPIKIAFSSIRTAAFSLCISVCCYQ